MQKGVFTSDTVICLVKTGLESECVCVCVCVCVCRRGGGERGKVKG